MGYHMACEVIAVVIYGSTGRRTAVSIEAFGKGRGEICAAMRLIDLAMGIFDFKHSHGCY